MKSSRIFKILYRIMEGMKPFNSYKDTFCDHCEGDILQNETFYFSNDKWKFCTNCYDEVSDYLEDKLNA